MRIFLILIFGIVVSCGVPKKDFDSLKQETERLKSENENLKKEIDEIKNGADRLLSEAKSLQSNNQYSSAKSAIERLLSNHKGSPQESEAKKMLNELNRQLEDQRVAIEKQAALQKKQHEQERLNEDRAEKQKLANATKKLRTSYDEIKGITWYYDKSTPHYTNYNSLHLYMGKEKNGRPWLRFRIQYAGDDWLFIQSYLIKTDNGSHTIDTSYGEVEKDNGDGGIWEWYDVNLNSELYSLVNDILNSKTNKLRCEGKQYYKDRAITSAEKQGLRNVLDAYEALGGQIEF